MANQPTKYRKFVVGAASAALVASAVAPVAFAADNKFTDMKGYDQHTQEQVAALVDRGIINGVSDTKFDPGASITRGQVVKLLGRYLVESGKASYPADWNKKKRFSDLPVSFPDNDLLKNAAVVYDAGVFKGNEGVLNSAGKITRENMALVLDRAAKAMGDKTLVELAGGKSDSVSDIANAKTEAQEAIKALNALEISTVNEFKPKNNVQRVHFATFLHNTMVVLGDKFPSKPEVPGVTDVKVESVTAITATDVTVGIKEADTDLEDQTVTVKDGAGNTYEVNPTTVKKGATSATFTFKTPLTVNATDAWTVNGVNYVAEFAVTKVETIDLKGKYINVQFSKKVTSLDPSEITVRATASQQAYGVESVRLSADGMSAQVTLLGDASTTNILTPGREYTLSVTQGGKVVSANFQVPNFSEAVAVTGYNKAARTLTFNGAATLVVPESIAIDFESLVGQDVNVWSDKDGKITRIEAVELTTKYDAVKIEKRTTGTFVKLLSEDKEYRIADRDVNQVVLTSAGYVKVSELTDGQTYASAKVVLDAQSQVRNIVVVDTFAAPIVVKSVEGNVVKGNASEYNLKDYTLVKNGKTITVADLKADDVVYYNNGYKYAEVYNGTVTGEITNIYSNAFKVNGKNYPIAGKYVVGNVYADLDKDALEAFQASKKPVTLHVDRTGTLRVVTGDVAEVQKFTTYDYALTNSDTFKETVNTLGYVKTINDKGETKEAKINASKLQTVVHGGQVYTVGKDPHAVGTLASAINSTDNVAVTGFKINGDGELFYTTKAAATGVVTDHKISSYDFDDTTPGVDDGSEVILKDTVISLTRDKDGNVIGINHAPATKEVVATALKDMTVKTLPTAANGSKQVKSSTPVFIVDGDDVKASTWGEVTKSATEISKYDFYYNNADVAYVVVDKADVKTSPETKTAEMVVQEINWNKDNSLYVADIKLASTTEGGVAKSYVLSKANITAAGVTEGDIVTVTLNKENDEVVTIAKENAAVAKSIDTTNEKSVDGNTITFADDTKVKVPATGLTVYEVIKDELGQVIEVKNVGISGLQNIKSDNALMVSYLEGNTAYADTIVITKNQDKTATPGNPGGTGQSQYLSVADVTEGATTTLTLTATGTIFTPNAEDFIDVSGLPTGYTVGTVTRVSNTQATIAITGSADFDADVASTVTVYNGGLNGVTTNQSTTAKFIAVDEVVTATTNTPADNKFTLTNNFNHTAAIGDVDLDPVTSGVQSTVVINGITYTVAESSGVYTVTATSGTATNSEAAKTSAIKIAVAKSADKTLTLNIPAVTAADPASGVTAGITVTN
ncbi:S-layer homology domain-containing protein [Sporosarcina sp.]|uniref:S-layer homology domain-containing protein n=1 Tax=Sporosarcina sp. TaxID=49982 RepID=UPI0026093E90|nr:S-layer homology domain-containing protein [Sporosarcina sp.]